jgi:uncharacterized protein YbjT (DUF2867 family)
MILIVGGTTSVGRSLCEELRARDTPYREIPTLLTGLRASLRNTRAVVLCNAMSEEFLAQRFAALEAARIANVALVINVSSCGAAKESAATILRWHAEIEQRAAQLGLAVTHLRPSFLMQDLLDRAASVAARGVLEMPMRSAACNFVDARDIAAVAVQALDHDVGQRVLELRGARSWTHAEIAARLTTHCGSPVFYRDICAPRAQGTLLREGRAESEIRMLLEWWGLAADGDLHADPNGTIEKITGRPPRTLEDFLREHAAQFTPRLTRRSASLR